MADMPPPPPQSPQPPPPAPLADSKYPPVGQARTLFVATFTMAFSRWKEALIIAGLLAVTQLVAWGLVYEAIDRIVKGDLGEILDRVTGLAAVTTTEEDELFFESLEAHLPQSAVVLLIVALVLFIVPYLVCGMAWMRLFVAERNGVEISSAQALSGALRRSPMLLLLGALGFVVFGGLGALSVLIISQAPLLALLIVPANLALGFWLVPYVTVAYSTIAVGPQGTSVIPHAIRTVRTQWVFTFKCLIMAGLPAFALNFATSTVSQGAALVSIYAYMVISVVMGTVVAAVQSAGIAAVHHAVGAATDPSLT